MTQSNFFTRDRRLSRGYCRSSPSSFPRIFPPTCSSSPRFPRSSPYPAHVFVSRGEENAAAESLLPLLESRRQELLPAGESEELRLLDFALLRVYSRVSRKSLLPFLQGENSLDFESTQSYLAQAGFESELVAFYGARGRHELVGVVISL